MLDCVILLRKDNGTVTALLADGDALAVFPHMDAAIAESERHPLCRALPFQIVELDEL